MQRKLANTLELVGRIRDYLDRKNAVLAGSDLGLILTDDQTVATREAPFRGSPQANRYAGGP